MKIKRFLAITCVLAVFLLTGCAAKGDYGGDGNPNDYPPVGDAEYADMYYTPPASLFHGTALSADPETEVEERYALLARDNMYVDGGYYNLKEALEYSLYTGGVKLGKNGEREIYYAREDGFAYGLYRTEYSGGTGKYYSFKIYYTDAELKATFGSIGTFSGDEAIVGTGSVGDIRFAVIGESLIAFDINLHTCVARKDGFTDYGDYAYFQQENISVSFWNGKTELVGYNAQNQTFSTLLSVNADLQEALSPKVVDNCYVLNCDGQKFVYPLDGRTLGDEEKEQIELRHTELDLLDDYGNARKVTDGQVTAEWTVSGGVAPSVNITLADGFMPELSYRSFSVSADAFVQNSAMQVFINRVFPSGGEAYDESRFSIDGVKLVDGNIFVSVEYIPEEFGFEGLNGMAKRITPKVYRWNYGEGGWDYVGSIPHNVNLYRILPLAPSNT